MEPSSAPPSTPPHSSAFSNADFPVDDLGRTYHLQIKPGDVANKILTCGDVDRVRALSKFLDHDPPPLEIMSERGFLTITGKFKGEPISIISSLMGFPNIDFMIRESMAVIKGPVTVVRFGTSGGVRPDSKIGDLSMGAELRGVYRLPDGFRKRPPGAPEPKFEERYHITKPVAADPALLHHMTSQLQSKFGPQIKVGLSYSGCSFFSSQGRPSQDFDDHNEELIAKVSEDPNALSFEMETFHMYDLADISRGRLKAFGAHMIIAERLSKAFITPEQKNKYVTDYGLALLEGLASFKLE